MKDKEKVSEWAKAVFDKSTKVTEGENRSGEFDWQLPVNLERLIVILDKLGLLEE